MAAAKAADAGKKAAAPAKGAPPPVDPESTLPGPSKFLLEPVLRSLGTIACYSSEAVAWLADEPLEGLVELLSHHSVKIQVRVVH